MFVDHSDEGFPPILVSLYHSVKALGHPLQDGDGDRVEEVEDEAETILREVKQASVPLPGGVGGVARRAVHHRIHPASIAG